MSKWSCGELTPVHGVITLARIGVLTTAGYAAVRWSIGGRDFGRLGARKFLNSLQADTETRGFESRPSI